MTRQLTVASGVCAALCALANAAYAATPDFHTLLVAGSLGRGVTQTLFDNSQSDGPHILSTTGDITILSTFENGCVGGTTFTSMGSLALRSEVNLPDDGSWISSLDVHLNGLFQPGQFAKNPFIAWTERLIDVSSKNAPKVLFAESGVDFTTGEVHHYDFEGKVTALRMEYTFFLDGVTYADEHGRTRIDPTACVQINSMEQNMRIVPEPGMWVLGLAGLGGLLRRRR